MTAQELNQSLKEIHYNMLLKLQEAQAMDEEECLGEGCEEYDDEDEYEDEEDEGDDYEDEE